MERIGFKQFVRHVARYIMGMVVVGKRSKTVQICCEIEGKQSRSFSLYCEFGREILHADASYSLNLAQNR